MGHRITVAGVIVTLVVCSVGLLGATRPLTMLFPVSGATDITIIMLGWNAWQSATTLLRMPASSLRRMVGAT
jgi:hypothetical protein